MPVAPTPQIAPTQPLLRTAAYVRPAPDRLAGDASATAVPSAPTVQKASLEVVKPAIEDAPKAKAKPKADARPKAGAPVRLAHADPIRSLLPDDIGQLAAREAHGARDSSKAAR